MRGLASKFRSAMSAPGMVRMPDPMRARSSETGTFLPPTKGLMLFDDVSDVPDGGAILLENIVCGTDTVRARGGSVGRNTGIGGEVRAFLRYLSGANANLFVIGGGGTQSLFDVSAAGAVGSAIVSGLTPTNWFSIQFSTLGDEFLIATGAGNDRLLYDGTTWETTPSITGVSMSALSHVSSHGRRLFFVEQNSQNIWYLPVDSVGGTATKFPLGGEFKLGGTIVATASWTVDAGNSGLKSSFVIISSEGEVAVYEGPDPASWSSVGVYQVGRPCGLDCFMKTGGDLAIMTEDGLIAMSQVVSLDRAALVNQSVSKNVLPIWRRAATTSDRSRWSITRRDREGYAVVSIPASSDGRAFQLVVNLQTGAWSVWRGWDVTAMVSFGNELLYGTADGRVLIGEEGGQDDGVLYTARYIGPFKSNQGRVMVANLMRVVTRATQDITPFVCAQIDYNEVPPASPSAVLPATGAVWNTGIIWNSGVKWSGGRRIKQAWQGVSGVGSAIAPCWLLTISQSTRPRIEFIRTDLSFETGEAVT